MRYAHPNYETIPAAIFQNESCNKKGGPGGPPFRVSSVASSAAVAADHRAHGLVGSKILGAVDIQQRRQFRTRTVDAALDGTDRAATDGGGVLIGKAGGANQDQRFA